MTNIIAHLVAMDKELEKLTTAEMIKKIREFLDKWEAEDTRFDKSSTV